ncbi:hypothetical protein J8F10_07280 [Gemmata sp. G18]|uniref:Uncharacterized protein n=1 Tax=Gemmata palustris TaxID=2822762 RepID=A0ABS5BN25_9BACT|nr:hypothetical protein [Gemmata palustris]MBP3955080.1 hypothetical protein [Gemmata palustris]
MRSSAPAGSHTCQCRSPPANSDGPQRADRHPPTISATPHATTNLRNNNPHRCPTTNPYTAGTRRYVHACGPSSSNRRSWKIVANGLRP